MLLCPQITVIFCMAINLKKLQSIGRRRLGLTGEVEFLSVDRAKGNVQARRIPQAMGGVLATTTNSVTLKHTISYSNVQTLEPADVYHELCRAKLDELGFRTIEAAALSAIRECCKDDPKFIIDANSSVIVVAEVYTNWLLFNFFPDESSARREEMVLRFESSDALTSLHTRMGFWGIAGVAYYKVASEWSGNPFPDKQVEAAVRRASDGASIAQELTKIESILHDLPRLAEQQDVMPSSLSDSDQILIVEGIVRLFSAKSGLECE